MDIGLIVSNETIRNKAPINTVGYAYIQFLFGRSPGVELLCHLY